MIAQSLTSLSAFEFLQRALVTSVVVGIVAGVLGTFVVLRGMALMGDTISHAVIPGVAVSYMLNIPFVIGATVFGVLASFIIGVVGQKTKLKNDAAMGITLSSFFALGIILIAATRTVTDLHHILFGNVLAVSPDNMRMTIGVAAFVLVLVLLFYKELLISTFDPTMAKAYGLKTELIHYGLMFVLTLVAVTALHTLGIIMVIAMLITPASTGYLLTDRLSVMIVLAATFGAVSSTIGLFFSYSFNLPSGATIVLVAATFFLLASFLAPKKGILFKNKKERKT